MRLLIVALLAAISYAQTDMYASIDGYNKVSADAAHQACTERGMELCTAGQLFNAVFNLGWGDMCYSGWIRDEYDGVSAGWFNANGNCGAIGWNKWAPQTPGSHCCSPSLEEITPTNCASFNAQNCVAAGNKIIIDAAQTVWCTTGTCDVESCCMDFIAAPEYITLPETSSKYIYESGEAADAACQARHPDLRLCTKYQVRDSAERELICSSGWWVTEKDDSNEIVAYDRGWYVGEAFSASCGGVAGERAWKAVDSSGKPVGSAHCCVPSYIRSGYNVIGSFGQYSLATAEIYCKAQGYSYQVCSKAQLETVVQIEYPNVCMSGFLSDDEGWWQGDVAASGCGAASTFNEWIHPTAPGAHCCLSYVQAMPVAPLEDYGIIPESGQYGQSTFSTGALAQQACIDRGYDQLCTLAQQAYVEENPSQYGDIACKVGWVTTDTGYDSGYWAGCGTPGAWNNAWKPSSGNPVAHCCFQVVPELEMTKYPYYNGGWTSYATQAAAEAMCTGDYGLCTIAQLKRIATETVTYEGVDQYEPSICKQGWTSEGEKGWWQGQQTTCGTTGWRSFNGGATYHCCLPFEAGVEETTETPMPPAFIQHPQYGYPYTNAQQALDGCLSVDSRYSLCADYEIIEAATSGIVGNSEFSSVAAQTNLCFPAYTDPDRSETHMYGWYVSSTGTCSGGEGWKSWRSGGTNAGAYCCYSSLFTQSETDSPSTAPSSITEPPVTTTITSLDPSDMLPSTLPQPEGCVDTGFTIEGFPGVNFCSASGTIYLNGRDTCVPSGGDESEMYNALQTVWEDQWYLAAGACTADKTFEEATDDQLWITQEMCNNLEEDLARVESATRDHSAAWSQAVIDLVRAQKGNFNEATQRALEDVLATIGS